MSLFEGNTPFICDQRADTAFIHETSWVDSPCHIGDHTAIMPFSHIMSHSVIGNYCRIGRNVTISSGVLVGDSVLVMDNSRLNSGVILENEVTCGPGSIFIEMTYVRAQSQPLSQVSPTLVRYGAKLGANTTIAAGFTVGRYAFVEAGTVVDRNIPDFGVVYGNPLKFAGWRCECGQMLPIGAFSSTDSKRNASPPSTGTVRRDSVSSLDKTSRQSEHTSEIHCMPCGRRYQRLSKWKMHQLTQREPSVDGHADFGTDSQPDSPIRNA